MTRLHRSNRFIVLLLFIAQFIFFASCTSTARYEGSHEQFEDIMITTQVHEAILDDLTLRPFDINVRTIKGTVELSGLVNSREDMDKAIAIARKIEGVRFVKNDMRTYGTGDY